MYKLASFHFLRWLLSMFDKYVKTDIHQFYARFEQKLIKAEQKFYNLPNNFCSCATERLTLINEAVVALINSAPEVITILAWGNNSVATRCARLQKKTRGIVAGVERGCRKSLVSANISNKPNYLCSENPPPDWALLTLAWTERSCKVLVVKRSLRFETLLPGGNNDSSFIPTISRNFLPTPIVAL